MPSPSTRTPPARPPWPAPSRRPSARADRPTGDHPDTPARPAPRLPGGRVTAGGRGRREADSHRTREAPAMPIATVNPATGETLETFEPLGEEALDARLTRAANAFAAYRTTGFDERAKLVHTAADLLDADRDAIARTITLEMGKPVQQAAAEVAKCAKALRWYADHAAELLADEHPSAEDTADAGASQAYVRYRPLGPVLAVMPWNF